MKRFRRWIVPAIALVALLLLLRHLASMDRRSNTIDELALLLSDAGDVVPPNAVLGFDCELQGTARIALHHRVQFVLVPWVVQQGCTDCKVLLMLGEGAVPEGWGTARERTHAGLRARWLQRIPTP